MTSIDHVRVHTVKRQAHLKYKYLLIRLIYTKLEIDFQTSFIFFFKTRCGKMTFSIFTWKKKSCNCHSFPNLFIFQCVVMLAY